MARLAVLVLLLALAAVALGFVPPTPKIGMGTYVAGGSRDRALLRWL